MKLTIQKRTAAGSLPEIEITDIQQLFLKPDDEPEMYIDPEEEEDEEDEDDDAIYDEALFAEENEMEEEEEMMLGENDEEYLIELALPGFNKEDFIIEIGDDNILSLNTVAGTDPAARHYSGNGLKAGETAFSRLFRLPDDADNDKIEARYENDILMLSIGKVI